MAPSPVTFQVDPTSVPSVPSWMQEVAVFAHILAQVKILSPARTPVLWRDWPGGQIQRQWIKLVRSQTVEVTDTIAPAPDAFEEPTSPVLTRSQRAHWRLSWEQRLARNARCSSSPLVRVTLYSLTATFSQAYGLPLSRSVEIAH